MSEDIQHPNSPPVRALSRLFACPSCHRLDIGLVFHNGRRRCRVCVNPDGKSSAELWVEADPSLRSLIQLLQKLEAYGEGLPDYARAFDPVIQQIRVLLTRTGHVPSGADLSSKCAATILPNILVEIGVAKTLHEAKSLRLSQVVEALEQAPEASEIRIQEQSSAVDTTRQPTKPIASNPTEAEHESDSAPRSAESSDDSQLTPEQRAILEVLAKNNAVDEDRLVPRRKLKELCKKKPYVVGDRPFRDALTMLRRRGLVEAKRGRQGGQWLTRAGQALLKCDSHSHQSEKETERDTSATPPLFPCSSIQWMILEALNRKQPQSGEELMKTLGIRGRETFHGKNGQGGKKELMELGYVANSRASGGYHLTEEGHNYLRRLSDSSGSGGSFPV